MTRAAQHYQRMARQAERFHSEPGIGDAKAYRRLASMDRARAVRRNVAEFLAGIVVGLVILFLMAVLWN